MAKPMFPCPPGWESITLEPHEDSPYIINVDSGGTPRTANSSYWNGDMPWLTPKEITRNGQTIFVSATERNISRIGLQNCGAKLLPPGTVMLTKRAPVGAVAMNTIPMATNQGFLNFQCGEKLRALYLAHWFRANVIYLQQVANGSTYRELYKSDLFEFKISLPPLEIQDAIISVINALQYVALLGLVLEQSATSPSDILEFQNQSRRLINIQRSLVTHILAGNLDVSKVSALLKGT